MWECRNCHKEADDWLDVCWNCGGARDGTRDLTFEQANDYRPSSLDGDLAARFVCLKCKNTGAKVKRIAVTGTGLSNLINYRHNIFIAVSCSMCGYTEFYDHEILE